MIKIHNVEAITISDLWFQAVHDILDRGRRFTVDQGSFAGQTRLEYDYFIGHITRPGAAPILPEIPEHCGVPAPVDPEYVYGSARLSRSYIEYLMTDSIEPNESYTYGERLTRMDVTDIQIPLNQIEIVIDTYKRHGHRTNQMILQVARPDDLLLEDPPCLRHIDTRIQDDRLSFFVYFRSWDLWSGLPANLAGIQTLKSYMAGEIGVADGEMIVESKGLHLYGYAEELARLRCLKGDNCKKDLTMYPKGIILESTAGG